ncbi:hypothetical protein K0M31_017412 [Melipona bicolor]|uniref:Uncharacterized protein n=1 Tax=Melipona bicolor TaxID=60889 RepID=A0AA40G4U0_9HYME|nr:hypothetical protein K0M31_017412 [Melipona bicolor]
MARECGQRTPTRSQRQVARVVVGDGDVEHTHVDMKERVGVGATSTPPAVCDAALPMFDGSDTDSTSSGGSSSSSSCSEYRNRSSNTDETAVAGGGKLAYKRRDVRARAA